ncbi:magnetosome protein, partial [Candidatus Magnetomorum sp. HK-1]
PTAGMPTAGMPTAGMPTAGMPVAGMPTAGMPVAGQPELIPPMGQTAAGVMVSGQPATIPPMGQTTAGTVSQTSTGALQGTVDGNCVCPVCGTTVPHERGTACYTIPCPKCKTLMVNEGAIINRTAITTTAVNTTPVQLTTALTIAGAPSTIPMTTTPGQVNTTTDTLSATPVTGIIDLPAMTIAGTGSGSVCIAATGPKITSQVADIFDKAPYFLIVGLGKIKAIPNPNVTDLLGSGVQSAQLIVSEGAKVLITNDIGIRAIKELETLNVKVYTGI